MLPSRFSSVQEMVKLLALEDVDLASRCFFTGLLEIMSESNVVSEAIAAILETRPRVTDEHLAWLIFSSLQYVGDYTYDDLLYMDATTVKGRMLQDFSLHKQRIIDLCTHKYICTNVVNRYAGLQIVLALMYGSSPVRVLEIGCSLGLGLMSLNTGLLESAEVSDKLLLRALHTPVQFDALVGVDIQEPDLEWLCACYLPEYRDHRTKVKQAYDQLVHNGQPFEFVRADALQLTQDKRFSRGTFDIVWISNTCYQVEGDQDLVEQGIRSLLRKGGAWLYTYYRNEQPGWVSKDVADSNPYVVGFYPNGTRRNYLEILQSDDDKVRSLSRGRDFDEFYGDFTR